MVPDTIGYVWTAENDSNMLRVDAKIFVSAKKYLRKKKFPDTCGHGLLVSRKSIICLNPRLRQIVDLLSTDKSRYFAQPRPIIVIYFDLKLGKRFKTINAVETPAKNFTPQEV